MGLSVPVGVPVGVPDAVSVGVPDALSVGAGSLLSHAEKRATNIISARSNEIVFFIFFPLSFIPIY